jgi:sphingomyelin phosphodiesterase acid-like 3
MWNETYIKTYKKIVSQYTDIVKAQFFGHVHSIEFRLPLSSSLSAQLERWCRCSWWRPFLRCF